MSIFEPLFLLLALIATVTLVVAGVLAMAGRRFIIGEGGWFGKPAIVRLD